MLVSAEQRRQEAASDLHAAREPLERVFGAFFGQRDHRQALVGVGSAARDQPVLEQLAHDDADGRRIHRRQPAEMVLRDLAMLEDRGKGRELGRRQVLAGHDLLETQRRALVRLADNMRRVQVQSVSGLGVALQHLLAAQWFRIAVRLLRRPAFLGFLFGRQTGLLLPVSGAGP